MQKSIFLYIMVLGSILIGSFGMKKKLRPRLNEAHRHIFKKRATFFFHGLGDSCRPEIHKVFSCIETGAGLLKSVNPILQQAEEGCRIVSGKVLDEKGEILPAYASGFHFVGISQGGLIARTVFHICDAVRPYVKRLVTVGTPNLGINEIPVLDGIRWIGNIGLYVLENLVNNSYKESWSFYQYLNTKTGSNQIRYSPLIKSLLTTTKPDQTYASLEALVSIQFSRDELINPPSSSTFGVEYDEEAELFSSPGMGPVAEFMGLNRLIERNRLVSCAVPGRHLQLTVEQYMEVFLFVHDEFVLTYHEPSKLNPKLAYNEQFDLVLQKYPLKFLKCDYQQKRRLLRRHGLSTKSSQEII